jgi:hypothetical protein
MTDKNMSELSASAVERGTRVRVDTLSSSFNWDFFLLLAIIAAYYLLLLSNGTFQLFAAEMLDRTF